MPLTNVQLKFFADFIQKELGIVFNSDNYFQLEKRLIDISKSLSFESVEALSHKAHQSIDGHLRQALLDIATNNETSFFRDPKVFKVIENHIIPTICTQSPDLKLIRIWCAASSFGQEPYSLAMVLNEMKLKNPKLPRFEVIATDISSNALNRAKEAKYSQLEVQRGLAAQLLVKYFTKTPDDYWLLKPEIRVNVQFKKQNLLESFVSLGSFEFILCRNVLIYQTEDKKKEILEQISNRLSPKGILLLGSAESLLGISNKYEQICKDGTIYFQKK